MRRALTWFGPSALLAAVAIHPLEGCGGNGAASSGRGDASAPPGESSSGGSSSGGSSGGTGQGGSSSGGFGYEDEAGPTGSSSGGSSGGSSSGSGNSSGGNPFADVDAAGDGGCVTIPSSDIADPSASPASGTVMGNGLDALLCPGGASARILPTGGGYITEPFIFELDYTVAGAADFQFSAPAGASTGDLNVGLGIGSVSPGSYSGPVGGECGWLFFSYNLPVPPGLDCEAGAPPDCPPGCGTSCTDDIPGFCFPCKPEAPGVGYSAAGTTDCIGDTSTAVGSWTLSLTSVTEADDAGSEYTPHGTLTATMVNDGDAGPDTATMSVTF